MANRRERRANKKNKVQEEVIEEQGVAEDQPIIEEVLENEEIPMEDTATSFIEENQNTIFMVLVGVVAVIGLYLMYKQLWKAPREKQAMEQMYQAQYQFEQDSFQLALTNPGNGYEGLEAIANSYGSTAAGNSANLYTGISYLKLGKYDDAINYLSDFSADGKVGPILKSGLLGDAYAEKGELENALSYYDKAASAGNHTGLTPYYMFKQGLLALKLGNNSTASSVLTSLKEKYPYSQFTRDAEKYLSKASLAQ